MKVFCKIDAEYGMGAPYVNEKIAYINLEKIGDTIFFKKGCRGEKDIYKVEYSGKYLFVNEENLQIILNYFQASNRNVKIDQILS